VTTEGYDSFNDLSATTRTASCATTGCVLERDQHSTK
jgi:hypothetical protein